MSCLPVVLHLQVAAVPVLSTEKRVRFLRHGLRPFKDDAGALDTLLPAAARANVKSEQAPGLTRASTETTAAGATERSSETDPPRTPKGTETHACLVEWNSEARCLSRMPLQDDESRQPMSLRPATTGAGHAYPNSKRSAETGRGERRNLPSFGAELSRALTKRHPFGTNPAARGSVRARAALACMGTGMPNQSSARQVQGPMATTTCPGSHGRGAGESQAQGATPSEYQPPRGAFVSAFRPGRLEFQNPAEAYGSMRDP